MARSSGWRPRCAAVVLAASACLIGGITSAQAAPDPGQRLTAPAVRTFTGNGTGTSPSQAVDGAVRMAYAVAQSAGWQAAQCHVRGTDVRSVGGGVYAAVASLYCQR
ncbi:hypothetical protein [Streptomyces sp. AN091965]|uniref:hypothetical protein n=1 Tax=Streptomyces sp. AN091965 TaxID=2927803 RepID=UPI001F61EF8C|nr:hypothetical protein [Streptomyces sp. AN091965]MCI3927932.1 hypothetical protein [Streptomyces sp. AN091965]